MTAKTILLIDTANLQESFRRFYCYTEFVAYCEKYCTDAILNNSGGIDQCGFHTIA